MCFIASISTYAATYHWRGGTSGTWETGSNWTPGVPSNTGTDNLIFSSGATFQSITYATNKVANSLSFDTTTGVYTLTPIASANLSVGTGGITVKGPNGVTFAGSGGQGIILTGSQTWNATS
ncbi:MAG TPA: hypothetical protein PLV25_06560, partial [Opitutales bacterium]|nr:hypothetical protein [Opitutales bacterium]